MALKAANMHGFAVMLTVITICMPAPSYELLSPAQRPQGWVLVRVLAICATEDLAVISKILSNELGIASRCGCRADQVPVVFSRTFLRCFSNNLISSKTYLHSSAQRIAQRLIVFAGKAKTIPGMQVCHAILHTTCLLPSQVAFHQHS